MFFGNNSLSIANEHGFELEFSPLEALKLVNATEESGRQIKVAYSESWRSKK